MERQMPGLRPDGCSFSHFSSLFGPPDTASRLSLAGVSVCPYETVLECIPSMMTAKRRGGTMTAETAEMSMKQFPRRSGQSNDTVIWLAMASNSAGGTEAQRSAPRLCRVSRKHGGDGATEAAGGGAPGCRMPSASCVDPQ